MLPRCHWKVFAVLGATLLGCTDATPVARPARPQRPSAEPLLFAVPEMAYLSGELPTVNLVVRGFVTRETKLDSRYAQFTYLYFAANSDQGRPIRLRVSRAFIQLFNDVEDADGLRVPHEKLAVLVAPIVGNRSPRTSEELIDRYDYSYAQLLAGRLQRFNHRLPPVALIASDTPLDVTADSPVTPIAIISLCGDERDVEDKVLRFRDGVVVNQDELAAPGFDALERVRTFLGALGGFALTPLTAPTDTKVPSQSCR